jgi:hypothetical protein
MSRAHLDRRLRQLERQLSSEPIVLEMPDGRTVTLPGPGDYAVRLLGAVFGDLTPELALVAQSISSTEPGGAHLIDLARALLHGRDA